jgi:hypothetical protein
MNRATFRAYDASTRDEIHRLARKYGAASFPQPPSRLARFLARSWPLRPIADWVYSVTNAVLAEQREEARIQALWNAPTDSEIRQLADRLADVAASVPQDSNAAGWVDAKWPASPKNLTP